MGADKETNMTTEFPNLLDELIDPKLLEIPFADITITEAQTLDLTDRMVELGLWPTAG